MPSNTSYAAGAKAWIRSSLLTLSGYGVTKVRAASGVDPPEAGCAYIDTLATTPIGVHSAEVECSINVVEATEIACHNRVRAVQDLFLKQPGLPANWPSDPALANVAVKRSSVPSISDAAAFGPQSDLYEATVQLRLTVRFST